MTDTIDNILSDLTDLTLTAANAGVIKAAITRAKERLAALFPAQPPSLTFSDDRATKLADHWLYEMKCDHDAKTDVACCSCGWVSEAKASVGEAAKVWASHALSTLEPK